MRAQLLAGLLTGVRTTTGALTLLDPRWWLRRQLNPHSESAVFERGRDAALFKLDMLGQNLFDRSLARSRWIDAVARVRDDPAPDPLPVPELGWDDDSLATFQRDHLAAQRPAVFRGLLAAAPGHRPWSFEEFIHDYGESEALLTCPVRDGYPGRLREIDVPGVYLHNAEGLLHRHPELLERAGFAFLPRTVARGLRFSGIVQLFAGRKRTGTWWHCAGGMNVFCMLEGTKRWSLIDPAFSPLLFPRTAGEGRSTYYLSDYGRGSSTYARYVDLLGEGDERAVPEAFERAFARCARLVVDLQPGDVLFVPAWWWHDVENTSPTSIGLATRWMDPKQPRLANPVFDIGGRLHPRFYYRVVRGVTSQKIVDRDGTVHFDRLRDSSPIVEAHTRAVTLENYVDFDTTVDGYYQRHGATR